MTQSDDQFTGAKATRPPAVELDCIGKVYGQGDVAVHALIDINLAVGPGSFVVFLGPSGSGKTTLLNIVGGIESPSGGRLRVAGEEITGYASKALGEYRRRRVGFVFQFFNLIPTLTALENVELIAELTGARDRGASPAVELLAGVGLAQRMDHFPAHSRGASNSEWRWPGPSRKSRNLVVR